MSEFSEMIKIETILWYSHNQQTFSIMSNNLWSINNFLNFFKKNGIIINNITTIINNITTTITTIIIIY